MGSAWSYLPDIWGVVRTLISPVLDRVLKKPTGVARNNAILDMRESENDIVGHEVTRIKRGAAAGGKESTSGTAGPISQADYQADGDAVLLAGKSVNCRYKKREFIVS